MDINLIKEKYYVDNTISSRNEIRFRNHNVCDESIKNSP
jgi:hypothetical protein